MSKTVKELYMNGQEKLAGAGIHDAAFDARALLSFVMDIPFRDIPLHYANEVAEEEQQRYDEVLGRRIGAEPLQYITGEQEFMGLPFHVDRRVLIPRLDTEILADTAIKYADKLNSEGTACIRVLDLCCGSGALGLSIAALARGETNVVLSDVSQDALDVAASNAESLGVTNKVSLVKGDLFENVEGDFDLVVCNPPYIRTDVVETLDAEVSGHEPMVALDGGKDGLDIYRRIAEEAAAHIRSGGCLMLEIGFDQAEDVTKLLAPNFNDIRVMKDLAGLDRVVTAEL